MAANSSAAAVATNAAAAATNTAVAPPAAVANAVRNAVAAAANAAAPANTAAATTPEVVSSADKIKSVLKTEFADKSHIETAQLLKEVLEAIATGPFITKLKKEADKKGLTNSDKKRTARVQAFMENKAKNALLSGGRRRKSRKANRKSRRKSRKAQRK